MSTENPLVSNFLGVSSFQKLTEKISLVVNDNGTETTLNFEDDLSSDHDPKSVPRLGLTLIIDFTRSEIQEAAKIADLSVDDLSLVVVAEDPFLKERDCIFSGRIPDDQAEIKLCTRGGNRPRSLLNSREGLRIEVVIILATPLEPKIGRPFRVGTRLGGLKFRVTSYPESGGISPVELTDEVREEHGLSKKTQLFVFQSDELLGAESLGDVITVYVEPRLLGSLKAARTGIEYDFVAAGLAVSAIQQIAYLLSAELNTQSDFHWGDTEEPVLAFIHQKLQDVSRVGKSKPTKDETIKLLKEEPQVVASLMTGLLDFTRDARRLLDGSED